MLGCEVTMKFFVISAFLFVVARCGDGKEYATVESTLKSIESLMSNSIDSHELKRRSTCVANQHFQHDCNTCKCSADGLSYRCTQNECMDKDDAVNKEVEVFKENEGEDHIERHSVCQPRGVFYIGCNTCHCNYYGTDYSCTNKPCPLPEDVELFHELKVKTASQNKTIVCAANKMFVRDCNTCWCNEDGTSFFCTRRICLPELPEDPGLKSPETRTSSLSSQNKTIVCEAKKSFVKDCNRCWCSDDGTSFFCTRRICLPELPDLPEDEGSSKDLRIVKRECNPGEVFEIECNMCRCNPDGMSFSCTRKACFKDPPVIEGVDDDENSSPTRKTRGSGQDVPKNCQPGQTFRLDCNTCLCDNEGREFSCTRNDCRAENSGRRRRRGKNCQPGQTFRLDCNTCLCDNEGREFSCTKNDCRAENSGRRRRRGKNCQPGQTFRLDCNTCLCDNEGREFSCTRNDCRAENSGWRRRRGKNCQPGQTFRLDCNTCLCDNEGREFSCTKNDCRAENNGRRRRRAPPTSWLGPSNMASSEHARRVKRYGDPALLLPLSPGLQSFDLNAGDHRRFRREVAQQEVSQCQPGSVFDIGCNVCRCADDGKHATCTLRGCSLKPPTKDTELPESDSNFRCNPGEQFRRGCNDCTCSADGKSVFCTIRLCEKDLMPKF